MWKVHLLLTLYSIRHIVTRSIQGISNKYKADIHLNELQVKDKIIICTDGVLDRENINSLSKIEIESLEEYSKLFEDGSDNASLICISF